jgi:hypothetical protein
MERMEYRIESITLSGSTPDADQIVARLNELAADGWRVGAIDLAGHPSYSNRSVTVLLERAATLATGRTPETAGALRA